MTSSDILVNTAIRATLSQIVATGALVFCQQAPPLHPPLSAHCPPSAQKASSDNQPAEKSQNAGRRGPFYNLIEFVGKEDEGIHKDMREGKDSVRERTNYRQVMRIREDEEQAVHTILVDAYYRLKENQKEHAGQAQEIYQDHLPVDTCEEFRKLEILQDENRFDEGKKGGAILDEAIFHVYQELGEEDFKKVDRYAYELWGPGFGAGVLGKDPWTYSGPPEPPATHP
jgi:hypothetical protein